MLELSLFGQIPASRHDQALKILAGIAAMPPHRIVERHLVFRPLRTPVKVALQMGGSQGIQDIQKAARNAQTGGDLYHLRLVEDISPRQVDKHRELSKGHVNGYETSQAKWSLRFYDVPEPGKKPVIARTTSVTQILDGDAVGFMDGLGYQFIHQYIIEGHQVIHNNIILHLHRMMSIPEAIAQQPRLATGSLPAIHELLPLDESAAYMLHASVNVLDGSKPDVVARGTAELSQLKDLLKGSIELRVVDRLSLDTRVK